MSKKKINLNKSDDRLRIAVLRKDLEENPRPLDQLEAELKEGNWPRRIRKKAIWQLSQEPEPWLTPSWSPRPDSNQDKDVEHTP